MTALTCILIAAALAQEPAAIRGEIETDGLRQLLTIRRVYVDRLTGGETAAQMRELLVSSLDNAKLFIITENPDRADAVLRGGAEDLIFTELHASAEGINVRANAGTTPEVRFQVALGPGFVFVTARYFKTWAERDTWQDELAKAYGQPEADRLVNQWRQTLLDTESFVLRHRPELSRVRPPAAPTRP